MTEKNADVEWLRGEWRDASWQFPVDANRARRLLTYIDELERQIEDFKKEAIRRALCNEPEPDRRPTIHEIAAQIMSGMFASPWFGGETKESAVRKAYAAAEALVAEGRRRDGLL